MSTTKTTTLIETQVTFSKEGTGGFNGHGVYCHDENSGSVNVLVAGELRATLYRQIERDTNAFGERTTRRTWTYCGPTAGREGEREVTVGSLKACKAFAIKQLAAEEIGSMHIAETARYAEADAAATKESEVLRSRITRLIYDAQSIERGWSRGSQADADRLRAKARTILAMADKVDAFARKLDEDE